MQPTSERKTTKAQLSNACDDFFWFLAYITGGTREETLRQAPTAVLELEVKAGTVAALAANPNKHAASDTWLMDRVTNIPARVQTYRERYVPAEDEAAPANVIPFPATSSPVKP